MTIYNDRCKIIREELGFSLKEMSAFAGVSPATYSLIENGRRSYGNPGAFKNSKSLALLVNHLVNNCGMNPDWFWTGHGDILTSDKAVRKNGSNTKTVLPTLNEIQGELLPANDDDLNIIPVVLPTEEEIQQRIATIAARVKLNRDAIVDNNDTPVVYDVKSIKPFSSKTNEAIFTLFDSFSPPVRGVWFNVANKIVNGELE